MTADPLIVITEGRTGSTFLMRLLNCIKSVYIYGEHRGGLKHLFKLISAYDTHNGEAQINASRITRKLGFEKEWIAWATPFDRCRLKAELRMLIENLYKAEAGSQDSEKIVWGFKETSYSIDDVISLAELFPEARFIFNTRNIYDYFKSWHRAFKGGAGLDRGEVLSFVSRYFCQLSSYSTLANTMPGRVLIVDYDRLIKDLPSALSEAANFIGKSELDIEWERASAVSANRTDYSHAVSAETPEWVTTFQHFRDVMETISKNSHSTVEQLIASETLDLIKTRLGGDSGL